MMMKMMMKMMMMMLIMMMINDDYDDYDSQTIPLFSLKNAIIFDFFCLL